MNKDDEPAYPVAWRPVEWLEQPTGFSKREEYARAALMGMHARDQYDEGLSTPQQRARIAFLDADAMIAEGEK